MNVWESIFTQSPVNNGYYVEDELAQQNWAWPTETWFQARLNYIREHEPLRHLRLSRKLSCAPGQASTSHS
jgi:hypothetical protein